MPDLPNLASELFSLAVERENAKLEYSQYESLIQSRQYVALNDTSLFAPIYAAKSKLDTLDKQVAQKSDELFKVLPDSLQFAVKALQKPLHIGTSRSVFHGTASYALAAKEKPVDDKDKVIDKEPDYTYDVIKVE